MKEQFIDLTDGTRIEVKVNFGTMYHLQKSGANRLATKIEKKQKAKKKITEDEQMEFSAKVIYALLRSNGRKVTFDEALALIPTDTESIQAVIDAFNEELEKTKKKEEAKKNMTKFQRT